MIPKFENLEPVRKPKGYKFDGWIVSTFKKRNGEIRVVAENEDGMLHIFNEDQLERRLPSDDPVGPYDIKAELEFALARINEWEGEEDPRDWIGHVQPSLSRLRKMV